jgi:hypothetical protein
MQQVPQSWLLGLQFNIVKWTVFFFRSPTDVAVATLVGRDVQSSIERIGHALEISLSVWMTKHFTAKTLQCKYSTFCARCIVALK